MSKARDTANYEDKFASGTKMIFNQTAAPTGWTKVTGSGNDTALRVTTGTVGTGGSVAFETAFASQTIPTHQLIEAEMPEHEHYLISSSNDGGSGAAWGCYLPRRNGLGRDRPEFMARKRFPDHGGVATFYIQSKNLDWV